MSRFACLVCVLDANLPWNSSPNHSPSGWECARFALLGVRQVCLGWGPHSSPNHSPGAPGLPWLEVLGLPTKFALVGVAGPTAQLPAEKKYVM